MAEILERSVTRVDRCSRSPTSWGYEKLLPRVGDLVELADELVEDVGDNEDEDDS